MEIDLVRKSLYLGALEEGPFFCYALRDHFRRWLARKNTGQRGDFTEDVILRKTLK